jgi:GDP-L-fucose synthase
VKVFVAGYTGLVGRATSSALQEAGHRVWIPGARYDLRDQAQVKECFDVAGRADVDAVVLAAARVGGIGANSAYPVDFLYDNIAISTNVIRAAWEHKIPRLLNLGSSCIYPRGATQPMKEEALLSGPLESTNEAYAIAKIAALKLVQAYRHQYDASYISLMPTNLYGDGDRYDAQNSHVIPALILKFEEARRKGGPVILWGTGNPYREFLHVDDLARAIVFALESYDEDLWLNVGSDTEISIRALAKLVQEICGFNGDVIWDTSKPDGVPRKKLDWSRLEALGWKPKIGLPEGLWRTVQDYRRRRP